MIPVTKPFSPPIEDYQELLLGIWQSNWFTNNVPLVNDLELKLKKHLGLKHLLYTSNGTIAIQIALKALGITKKVITTPFSYVATTSSLVWEGCTPVYVDIDPETFNIDPTEIESAIDRDTEAILATHCFGNPCDIEAIDQIAKKHKLKVIYDAAHCFGTLYKDKSILSYGDASTISFHATKLFHTIEGGAIIVNNEAYRKNSLHMRNFGHNGPEAYYGYGINGKNSEFHAAMGLANMTYIDSILRSRRKQSAVYHDLLSNISEIRFQTIQYSTLYNHSYFPVLFKDENTALNVKSALEKEDIFPRRYFYPSLDKLYGAKNQTCIISRDIASKILCLPVYFELDRTDQD
jgi:dTDP-4-amino-4,6-dideoxygalactose transaminase